MDEANIETHGKRRRYPRDFFISSHENGPTKGMKPYAGRLADDSDWEEAFMVRLQRMYERDKNHCCIIGWSLGNESGYGYIHDKMAKWIRACDPTRVLFYEPASYGPAMANPFSFPITDLDGLAGKATKDRREAVATDVLCPMYVSPSKTS